MLIGPALFTRRDGGKQWRAWSLRCLSALLEFTGCAGQLHVLSCHAPTRVTRHKDKDNFFNQVAAFISLAPVGEHYILGDFNPHVGLRNDDDDDQLE